MRILLVEDDRSLSRAVSTILQKNNYSVDCVENGQTALDYLEKDIYDAVIMDIMMPVMDGITALKNLRKCGSNIPVLMLTAKTEIDDKVEGLDNGANDYLTKPFDTRELLARIRVMMRRKPQFTSVYLHALKNNKIMLLHLEIFRSTQLHVNYLLLQVHFFLLIRNIR